MRNAVLLAGVLILQHVQGQAVLDRNAIPTIGTIYGYHDVPFFKAGTSGEGMRWNYADLPPGAIVPYSWTNADIAPGAGAFPSDALVRNIPGESVAYFTMGDEDLLWMGTYSDTSMLRFDPPLRELKLPCHIGDQWIDSGIVAVTGAGRMAIRSVVHNVKVDSWGSLIMPYGDVENVLRIRSELTLVDPRFKNVPVRREVRYSWHSPRTPMPLLVITERSGWPPPERMVRWLDGTWQDDPASLFRPIVLRPFPDPFLDFITVDLPASRADRTLLQLVDAMGNVAKQWLQEFNSPQTRRLILDLANVPAGNYTLTWIGTNGTLGSARMEKQ